MNQVKTTQKTNIPAIDCPLSGAYLIEASAGTGKTWTLTGIMLRLLIEKNIAPERIVATTFTRAAASEMKERLYERLNDFYEVCLWAKHCEYELFNADDKVEKLKSCEKECIKLKDPINHYLIQFILAKSPKELDKILIKTKVLLASVDKLFIGTLDSLAQKWLREFGDTKKFDLIQDPSGEIGTIVHDTLRTLANDFYYNFPMLYQVMDKTIFENVDKMVKITQNATHFFTSHIDEVKLCDIDALFKELQDIITDIHLEDFDYFFVEKEKLYELGFKKNNYFGDNFNLLREIINILKNNQDKNINIFNELDSNQRKFIESITNKNINSVFKVKYDNNAYNLWHSLDFCKLIELNRIYKKIIGINENIEYYIIYKVAISIRENLAKSLEKDNKTSFTIEMINLLKLLSGKKGESIAQHIRHLYPVALIDEAQDINGEQAKLIFSIYLKQSAKKYLFDNQRGFLLCVGDPKQAIYRFRGGDVANYNFLKKMGLNTQFSLTINRRSNQKIINAINNWFDIENKNPSYNGLGDDIFYAENTADRQEVWVDWLKDDNKPIEFLHLNYQSNYDALYCVALHINTLLQSNKRIFDKEIDEWRVINPSDITILFTNRKDIDIMQSYLKKLNIDSISILEQNVFNSQSAEHLSQLLEAVIDPQEQKIMAVLMGIYGYTLKQSNDILLNNKKRNQILIYLKRFLHYWQKNGINSAITVAFEKPALLNMDFWSYLAKFENSERYLTDLWQIIDIISTWQLPPILFLNKFYQVKKENDYYRLSLPSESGINIMTIHRSKGLEFGIVYIFGLQKIRNDRIKKLYPYIEDNSRKLSVVEENGDEKNYYKELDKREDLDEKKRLGYVALTRASEQLYIVVQDSKQSSKNAMNEWGFMQDGRIFFVPERLKNDINMIALDELMDSECFNNNPYFKVQDCIQKEMNINWQDIYKKSYFLGIENTSFTNMVLNFDKQSQDGVQEVPTDDDLVSTDNKNKGEIQSRFMRGRKAGTFLHKVLQKITNGQKEKIVFDVARELGLSFDDVMQQEIESWIMMVVDTPFLASNVPLNDIEKKQAEFGFLLGLKDGFNPDEINKIFWQYGHKYIPEIGFEQEKIIGFLTGEIDLLYCYQGKYYIVDYKSNYLADMQNLYDIKTMEKAMNEHSYWLQAAIYQVALHRLLKLRINNYQGNEKKYLGAVEYVFLRGIDEDNKFGRLVWDIPLELILALDEIFG